MQGMGGEALEAHSETEAELGLTGTPGNLRGGLTPGREGSIIGRNLVLCLMGVSLSFSGSF